MRNIGLAFVRMGQYQDALQAFAQVMENAPEHQVPLQSRYTPAAVVTAPDIPR